MLKRGMFSIALGLAVFVAVSSSPDAAGHGDALFGSPTWKSVKVAKDGEPHPLFDDTTVRLKFRHDDGRDLARWHADCNFFGASVEIERNRIDVGRIASTLIGCPRTLLRQDSWLARFFRSDPKWARHGRTLRLDSGADRIVLQRRA